MAENRKITEDIRSYFSIILKSIKSYVMMPLVGLGKLKASKFFPKLRSEKVAPAGQQYRNSLVLGFRCQISGVREPRC